MASIFEHKDYKDYVVAIVKERGNKRGYWREIAEVMGCHASYLSKCLTGKAHLTSDHLASLAQFWNLSELEVEYLMLMSEMNRSERTSTKKILERQLDRLRDQSQNLKSRFSADGMDGLQKETTYYSRWIWMAAHIGSSIPNLQTANQMAKYLGIGLEESQLVLEQLTKWGFVSKRGNRYEFQSGKFHLGKESPLIHSHHTNWRLKAIDLSSRPNNKGVHYSSVYSIGATDFMKLKEMVIRWIEQSRALVSASPSEELICFNIDLCDLRLAQSAGEPTKG